MQPEAAETSSQLTASKDNDVEITCFSDILDEATVYFQIIRLSKQIYVWIGCNSTKLGPLYAAAPTRPSNAVSVTSLLGGTSDNTGSGIARRLVIRTGLNIVLACNLPKNNPILEVLSSLQSLSLKYNVFSSLGSTITRVSAEKKLVEKLIGLGYTKPKSDKQTGS